MGKFHRKQPLGKPMRRDEKASGSCRFAMLNLAESCLIG